MVHIFGNSPLLNRKKKNKAAFRGPMHCPWCLSGRNPKKPPAKWKYVEKVAPQRIRYRCKNCGSTIIYDFANNDDFLRQHPYYSYMQKNSKLREFINRRRKAKPIR